MLVLSSTVAQVTNPYIGGNQFGNYYTNPNYINTFLKKVVTTVSPACSLITGIGQPILAIKKVLQSVDTTFDTTNQNTSAKIIFFKQKNCDTSFQTTYKLVVVAKTYTNTNYIAIEGIYKQIGYPTFEVTTYYIDSDIINIRTVLGEYSIDSNGFVGCGDVKSIYCQGNPVLPHPTVSVNGQQTNPSQTPYAQGNQLLNKAPHNNKGDDQVDPQVIAQIIQLLQKN